jgi:predicted O-methyltransferase YrrM
MNYRTDGNFHTDFIEMLAKRMRPAVYLELGIAAGDTIWRVAPHCCKAVGVDVVEPVMQRRYQFFHKSTAEYLAKNVDQISGQIELAFIDADHSAKAVERDFNGLLPHMATNGLILLHDTCPENDNYKSLGLCGDCYKFASEIAFRAAGLDIEVVTLPFPPGLTIIRKL